MAVRIGFQGIDGSNSQEAAFKLAESLEISDAKFVPLETSIAVVNNLIQHNIDFGVLAFKNNIGGNVNETATALSGLNYETVRVCDMHIHHSLFFKDGDVEKSQITEITSHEQALFQCEQYLTNNYPHINLKPCSDTAMAAEQLKKNKNGKNIAVICKKEAGISRGLYLFEENIEDSESITEFRIIKLGQFETNNSGDMDKKSIAKKCAVKVLFGRPMLVLLAVVAALFSMCAYFTYSLYFLTGTAAALICLVVLTAFSSKVIAKYSQSNVLGFWKYIPNAVSGMDVNQMHDRMRMVRITETNGELKLEGWMSGQPKPFFVSSKILSTNSNQKDGKLVYWYNGTIDILSSANINGVAVLEWSVENENKQINKMTGWYLGAASKEIGTLTYLRVSKKEFENFKNERKLII